jgi:hypothetical protein
MSGGGNDDGSEQGTAPTTAVLDSGLTAVVAMDGDGLVESTMVLGYAVGSENA